MNIPVKSKSILTLSAILALGVSLSACTTVPIPFSGENHFELNDFSGSQWQAMSERAADEMLKEMGDGMSKKNVLFTPNDYSTANSVFGRVFQQTLAEKITQAHYSISYEKPAKVEDEVKWTVQVIPHIGRLSEVSVSVYWFSNGVEKSHRNYVRYIDSTDEKLYMASAKEVVVLPHPIVTQVAPLVTKPTVGIY